MGEPGAPTTYRPEYCEMLIDHMAGGLSFESFAGVVKCCKQTLYNWTRANPAFLDAKNRGEALSLLWWEKVGHAAMLGQTVRDKSGNAVNLKNFNSTVWIFSMKNRHGWRERSDVKVEGFEPLTLILPMSQTQVMVTRKGQDGQPSEIAAPKELPEVPALPAEPTSPGNGDGG